MCKVLRLAVAPLFLLAACGGGGGGTSTNPNPPPPGQVIATAGPPNVESLTMDKGPANALNTAFVSVMICAPGSTTNCVTVDHIEVDTGSSGLRVLATALGSVSLPVETSNPGGLDIAECLQFADGSSFGPITTADIKLPVSLKSAAAISVQVIGASGWAVPADCPGTTENTVADFGANGVLGVGPFLQDCGVACSNQATPITGAYYTCPTPTTCVAANVSTAQQVSNPVQFFSTDNNGVIVEMPSVPAGGAASIPATAASLVFGIGTESNNALGSATVLPASDVNGFVLATYNGTANLNAALDSGSNANFFDDNSIPQCTVAVGFYCPLSTLGPMATLTGAGGSPSVTAHFTVANAESLFNANPNAAAMPGVGGPIGIPNPTSNSIQFDLGMPFYFGRNVFTAIEGQMAGGAMGPYFAY